MAAVEMRDRENRLEWFRAKRGKLVSWPTTADGLLLATKARGIYKPSGSDYALSVRENLGSSYLDRPPRFGADGSWRYLYHQQGADTSSPRSQWDDLALDNCRRDGLPVGVLRQVAAKPQSRYEVLGVAKVVDWLDGYFVLVGEPGARGITHELIAFADEPGDAMAGPLVGAGDGKLLERDAVLQTIFRRRGQRGFRASLLRSYGCCAITGSSAMPALEAAHISTISGADLNTVSNGLLLRADLHTLFDLGLVSVHDRDLTVLLHPEMDGTEYVEYEGKPIVIPVAESDRPDQKALRRHRVWAGL